MDERLEWISSLISCPAKDVLSSIPLGTCKSILKLFSFRSKSHFSRIDSVVHDRHPTLESRDLKEGDVSDADVIEGDSRVDPLGVVLGQAGHDVRNDFGAHALGGDGVSTLD